MVNEHLEEWKKIKKQIEDMPVTDELTQEFKTARLKSLNNLIDTEEKKNAK